MIGSCRLIYFFKLKGHELPGMPFCVRVLPVRHDDPVAELVKWSPPLGRAVVVAQLDEAAAALVETQFVTVGKRGDWKGGK